ncbi:MAG: pitrilysin family protein [Thermoanaerobaculales bacterium]|nr:pitrilysin family protein [Thermoanaerobaculales bacterium]
MIQRRASILIALALTLFAGPTIQAQEANVPVTEVMLDNGMRLLLVERHDSPRVSGGWAAHVGSANENYGITGIAHLFEHMMFKGTRNIGTTDYEAEMEIMAELDAIRSEMDVEYTALREAKRRGEITGNIYLPENQTPRLAELREKMKALQDAQREYIVNNEYDKIYTNQGATGLNAGTNSDATVYFIDVPSNKLELWFWMESDRLLNAVFREFYSERDVVREERRMRVESDPTAKYEEQFDFMFWGSIPYHHPVIGWPSDVESINRAQAAEFFSTFYAPNNITAAVVGDFDTDEAIELAKKYFGRIPRGENPPPEMITEEIEQLQERRMIATADTNPSVQIRWHAVPFVHKDSYALDVLSSVLSGRTGRLYKAMVDERTIATGQPYAYFNGQRYAGSFEVGAELAEGVSHEQAEAALLAEIAKLKTEPVSDRELAKVKNQELANSFRRLQSNFYLLLQLLFYDVLGSWDYINTSPAMVQAVTADDVMRVANDYFPDTGKNVLWYHRDEATEEDPNLAALSGQAKTMAKQAIAQIEQITDPAELQGLMSQVQSMMGQAPPEFHPALELIAARAQERLDGLSESAGEEE